MRVMRTPEVFVSRWHRLLALAPTVGRTQPPPNPTLSDHPRRAVWPGAAGRWSCCRPAVPATADRGWRSHLL